MVIPVTYPNGYALIEPGEASQRVSYVRPERAHQYTVLGKDLAQKRS